MNAPSQPTRFASAPQPVAWASSVSSEAVLRDREEREARETLTGKDGESKRFLNLRYDGLL